MRKKLHLLISTFLFALTAYSQVGINTLTPEGILHMQNTTSPLGMILPRVDSAQITVARSMTTPLEATAVYDNKEHCIRLKTSDADRAWSDCLLDKSSVINIIEQEIIYNGKVPARATKIAAGHYYAAIYTDASRGNVVYGMGYQNNNQIGTVTNGTNNYPRAVFDRTSADIDMGYYNGAAVTANGELWVWGYNNNGKNGTGNTTTVNAPRKISLPGGVSASKVRTGYYNTLVLGTDKKLYVSGYAGYGTLGNGTTSGDALNFQKIPFFDNQEVVDMDVFYYGAIAVTSNGNVYVWGTNSTTSRRLGLPTNVSVASTPTLLNPNFTLNAGESVVKVVLDDGSFDGGGFITNQGRYFAFGYLYYHGGGGVYAGPTNITAALQTGERFSDISMYYGVGLLTNQNKIYVAGSSTNGKLGTGSTAFVASLTSVTPATSPVGNVYTGISLGYYNMYVTTSSAGGKNKIYGAGYGANNQLGRTNESGSNSLVVVFE
ncbi:hypothetical protein HX13_18470 [Chryseobacterium sp. P1-3]|uniref:hypothetical protein n=1 Tax=Chryseobacterium sp. (strain P1-3) TaxID=1517683 RepID=UPI0004E79D45|nr:hypothetical protein [Chryseobacterium sp. P1-3]KFF73771.1 hypothetical protein HX13_18470 [Chryseobacterium sp. P1-3]